MKKYIVHIVWAVIVIVGFVGGLEYGKTMVPVAGPNSARAGFAGRGGTGGGGFTAGTITAMDSQSITLQLANGNSEVVFYSPSTTVVKPSVVPASDLSVGTAVMVGGSQNSDGSVTAITIQVRPAGSAGFGGPGGAGRGAATTTNSQ